MDLQHDPEWIDCHRRHFRCRHACSRRAHDWPSFCLCLSENLFNYIDRQVLAAVEPDIREDFFKANEIGTVNYENASTFGIGPVRRRSPGTIPRRGQFNARPPGPANVPNAMFLMGPAFDGLPRDVHADGPAVRLAGQSHVRSWPGLSSASASLVWTVAKRGVGIGPGLSYALLLDALASSASAEGVYGPIAPTMISDLYPLKVRGLNPRLVLRRHSRRRSVGLRGRRRSVLECPGARLAAWAFYLVVPPGMMLAIWCFFMREPPPGAAGR